MKKIGRPRKTGKGGKKCSFYLPIELIEALKAEGPVSAAITRNYELLNLYRELSKALLVEDAETLIALAQRLKGASVGTDEYTIRTLAEAALSNA